MSVQVRCVMEHGGLIIVCREALPLIYRSDESPQGYKMDILFSYNGISGSLYLARVCPTLYHVHIASG